MRLISSSGCRLFLLAGLAGLAGLSGLAACGGADAGDGLDIELADPDQGVRATTTIDGEPIEITARVVREAATTPEGEAYEEEAVLAVVTGRDGASYADLRHTVLSDDLSGTVGGVDITGREGGAAARRAAVDLPALAGTRAGVVLAEVSRRAAATLDSGDFADVEEPLRLVAEAGPYLGTLVDSDDFGQCGDGKCSVSEDDINCAADCGCAAEQACGSVAPFGCYCGADCAETGDCCSDSCETCGAGCPPCEAEEVPCSDGCELASNVCNGVADCPAGQDEAQCSPSCASGEMACDDGTCLGVGHFCDGKEDCAGGEDELCSCGYCEAR